MNSFLADALRDVPFLSRTATVDFRGVVDGVDFFGYFMWTVLLEEDFDDFEEDEREDFCADRSKDNNNAMINARTEARLIMRPPNTWIVFGIIAVAEHGGKEKIVVEITPASQRISKIVWSATD